MPPRSPNQYVLFTYFAHNLFQPNSMSFIYNAFTFIIGINFNFLISNFLLLISSPIGPWNIKLNLFKVKK